MEHVCLYLYPALQKSACLFKASVKLCEIIASHDEITARVIISDLIGEASMLQGLKSHPSLLESEW